MQRSLAIILFLSIQPAKVGKIFRIYTAFVRYLYRLSSTPVPLLLDTCIPLAPYRYPACSMPVRNNRYITSYVSTYKIEYSHKGGLNTVNRRFRHCPATDSSEKLRRLDTGLSARPPETMPEDSFLCHNAQENTDFCVCLWTIHQKDIA